MDSMYKIIRDNACIFPKGTILYLKDGYYHPKDSKACPFLKREFVERMPNVFKKVK